MSYISQLLVNVSSIIKVASFPKSHGSTLTGVGNTEGTEVYKGKLHRGIEI